MGQNYNFELNDLLKQEWQQASECTVVHGLTSMIIKNSFFKKGGSRALACSPGRNFKTFKVKIMIVNP